MCFLYELHEYIELLKEKYNLDENIKNDIEDIENNLVDIYYNNNIYNLKEQIITLFSKLTIQVCEENNNIHNIIEEMKENIIDIYGINKKKKKEYYSYICNIKNITIE